MLCFHPTIPKEGIFLIACKSKLVFLFNASYCLNGLTNWIGIYMDWL